MLLLIHVSSSVKTCFVDLQACENELHTTDLLNMKFCLNYGIKKARSCFSLSCPQCKVYDSKIKHINNDNCYTFYVGSNIPWKTVLKSFNVYI